MGELVDPYSTSFWAERQDILTARKLKLNISEVCRLAIREAIGHEIERSGAVPAETVQEYVKYLKEREQRRRTTLENLTNRVTKAQKQAEAEKEEQERVSRAIQSVVSPIMSLAKRRLYDPYGDFIEWWDELAADVSGAAGVTVSVSELQAVVRRG